MDQNRQSIAISLWDHKRCKEPLQTGYKIFRKQYPNSFDVVWRVRSLADFGEGNFSELCKKSDIIIFDHPFIGEIAKHNYLVDLQPLLQKEKIILQPKNFVASSLNSYALGGKTVRTPYRCRMPSSLL